MVAVLNVLELLLCAVSDTFACVGGILYLECMTLLARIVVLFVFFEGVFRCEALLL